MGSNGGEDSEVPEVLLRYIDETMGLMYENNPYEEMKAIVLPALSKYVASNNIKVDESSEEQFMNTFIDGYFASENGGLLKTCLEYCKANLSKVALSMVKRKVEQGVSSCKYLKNTENSRVNGHQNDALRFVVITNDSTEESLTWLINVKDIFSKQLPKMPPEYIVRLVMDKNHYSLLCIQNCQVVGGVCFRPYNSQRFAEIAFLAVSANHQVRGVGTLLMNNLKQYVKKIHLTHFLTYADNYAIGYFRKQGFTKMISMPRERWHGFIKDYDGGTLMECSISEYVDYLKIPEMIKSQRKSLLDAIKVKSQTDVVYPGITLFQQSKHVSNILDQIPGLKEAGWGVPCRHNVASVVLPPLDGSEEAKSKYALYSSLQQIFRLVRGHQAAWPFQEAVPDTVTDYLEVVQQPMDLSLVKKRLSHGEHYVSPQLLYDDLKLMCDNCKIYNLPESSYYQAADMLNSYIIEIFKKTLTNANLPSITY